ncbi:MAG: MATE family efflux transporter [Clostridia bacterium]|nr:MATE family efflux transporter [Clostridia bacterium]
MEQEQNVNKIGQDFSFGKLIKFLLPTMITQFFFSVFKTVDDGLFVTNYVGTNALSSINILFPYMIITDAVVFVFASGAAAVCSRKMGEGKQEEAKRSFTTITLMAFICLAVVSTFSLIFQKPILRLLGATDILMDDCVTYSTYMWLFQPIASIGVMFDMFYATAGKPVMSLITAVINGFTNIIFDYIFIVRMQLGVLGAAYATTIGNTVFTLIGVIFYMNRKHEIYFMKPWPHIGTLTKDVFSVGMAQFFNHIAISVSSYISNIMILKIGGEDGLAAYSIIGYLQWLVGSAMGGYADGVSSIFSYNYGAGNKERIHRYFWYSVKFLFTASAALVGICLIFAKPLISIYVQEAKDPEIFNMVYRGMMISPWCILFSGFGMFSARFFTAMNNGKAAAFISFMRNGVLITIVTLVLPVLLGIDGIWASAPVSELLGFFIVFWILWRNKDNYALGKDQTALLIDNKV